MGNLVRKPAQLLLNSIVAGDLAWSDTGGDPLVIKDYNIIPNGKVVKFSKSLPLAGLAHSVAVHPDIAYPADTSEFEWYLTVKGKGDFKTGKPDAFFLGSKTYQGYMGALGAENSGKINDTDLATLIDSMVATINADKDALVTARRSGIVLMLTAKSVRQSFEVQMPVTFGLFYDAALVGTDGGLTQATGVLTSATLAAYINRLTGAAFIDDFFNTGYNLVITDSADADNVATFDITDYAASGGTVTVGAITGGADDTGVDFYIQGVSDTYYHSTGYPSTLQLEDVQRIFPYQSMKAGYPASAFPSPGVADWARYYFRIKHDNAYSLDGSNHGDSVYEEVEIYVPKADAEATNGVNWDDHIFEFLSDTTNGAYVDPHGVASPWGLANA